ncbi:MULTISPECIES: type II toxin-antitoxin system CcdA family antitoxin [Klebsiella]|nr:type II toxin-antitoxin system CcdA family antitoxin [Klebsiella variicola]
MPDATPADPETKKLACALTHEENQEGLEALNCFHDEYGHFSDDYRTF